MTQTLTNNSLVTGSYRNQLLLATVAVMAAALSKLCLKYYPLAAPVRLLVVLFPLLPSLLYVGSVIRWVRQLDELQRRIHLEACGFCFSAMVLLAMCISLLGHGGFLPGFRREWESIALSMLALYCAGYSLARRHYR